MAEGSRRVSGRAVPGVKAGRAGERRGMQGSRSRGAKGGRRVAARPPKPVPGAFPSPEFFRPPPMPPSPFRPEPEPETEPPVPEASEVREAAADPRPDPVRVALLRRLQAAPSEAGGRAAPAKSRAGGRSGPDPRDWRPGGPGATLEVAADLRALPDPYVAARPRPPALDPEERALTRMRALAWGRPMEIPVEPEPGPEPQPQEPVPGIGGWDEMALRRALDSVTVRQDPAVPSYPDGPDTPGPMSPTPDRSGAGS
jgi:hypothetical protein